jgi:hypothetical protein
LEVVFESIRLHREVALQLGAVVQHPAYTAVVILSERLKFSSMLEVNLRLPLRNAIIVLRDKLLFGALQGICLLLGKRGVTIAVPTSSTVACHKSIALCNELGCIPSIGLFLLSMSLSQQVVEFLLVLS